MTCADKLRDRHDWWNEAPDECAADIAAGDIAAMLPEIAAVIEAAERISRSVGEINTTRDLDRALAALSARLDGAS